MKTETIEINDIMTHKRRVGRPMNDSVAATEHIHLRVTLARKQWYTRTARLYNQTISEWIQQECDKSSGYPPKHQNEEL